MKILSAKHVLEVLSAVLTVIGLVAVLKTFIDGHYIIPTCFLAVSFLMGNLAYYGFQGKAWAKRVLFWLSVLLCFHLFFALFFAKTPRESLGDAFLPVYLVALVVAIGLTLIYAKANRLIRGG